MNSSKPYLMRAIYEWITDNELTPYMAVDATVPGTIVPEQYIEDGRIILNIQFQAVSMLNIGNHQVEFDASFNKIPFHVSVPVRAVNAIYAFENGRGMVFDDEDEGDDPDTPSPDPNKENKPPKKGRPNLKIVK